MNRASAFKTRSRPGFTLVEIVLVLALVIALLGGVASLSERVMENRARSRAWTAAQETAELVIGSLDREISTCTAGDASVGSGVSGGSSWIRVVSRGVLGTESDIVVTELRFDASTGTVTGRRFSGGSDAGELVAVGSGLEAMRVLYRGKNEWVESFDSTREGSLPAAVQVELWFSGLGASDARKSAAARVTEKASGFPQRPPDRARVIAIPDAVEQDGEQVAGVDL